MYIFSKCSLVAILSMVANCSDRFHLLSVLTVAKQMNITCQGSTKKSVCEKVEKFSSKLPIYCTEIPILCICTAKNGHEVKKCGHFGYCSVPVESSFICPKDRGIWKIRLWDR